MHLRRTVAWFVTVLALALPLAAEQITFHLDPAATTIELSFDATLHTVDGTLRAKEGTIQLDPATGSASGRIVLDATSAETGNARRDRKMHEKILESGKYPEMVFVVERVSGAVQTAGRSELQLRGTLEMHGTRRPFELLATALIDGDRVKATGRATVPYMEWGIADPSFLVLRVAKEVRVTVNAVGRVSGGSIP